MPKFKTKHASITQSLQGIMRYICALAHNSSEFLQKLVQRTWSSNTLSGGERKTGNQVQEDITVGFSEVKLPPCLPSSGSSQLRRHPAQEAPSVPGSHLPDSPAAPGPPWVLWGLKPQQSSWSLNHLLTKSFSHPQGCPDGCFHRTFWKNQVRAEAEQRG